MTPDDPLEPDLTRSPGDQPPVHRLDELDLHVSRVQGIASARPAPGPVQRVRRVLSGIVVIATLAAFAVVILSGGRIAAPSAEGAAPPAVASSAVGAAATPSPAGSSAPAETASLSPTVTPTPEPTPEQTPDPTPEPTPEPTPKPTPRPTKAPPAPEPEGTPQIYTASGSLGQKLTVQGVAVTLQRIDTPPSYAGFCDRSSRETYVYAFRMSWKSPPDSIEPWVGVGAHPYNAVTWDPGWAVNQQVTLILCHKPGDNDRVFVETSPPGSPMILYRWRFS